MSLSFATPSDVSGSGASRGGSGELRARIDVAACYRLVHLYGMSDLTDGFASCRIAGTDDFVIGGYGLLPEMATASALHRRPIHAEAKLEKKSGVDLDAYNFTRAVLSARSEFAACLHAHPDHVVALSSISAELLPMSQFSIMFHGKIAYIDFADTEVTSDEMCDLIVEHLAGGAELIILRNHGVIAPGRTMAQSFHNLYRIEKACRYQLLAMSSGQAVVVPGKLRPEEVSRQYWTQTVVDNDGSREWDALLHKLDRIDPSYRD